MWSFSPLKSLRNPYLHDRRKDIANLANGVANSLVMFLKFRETLPQSVWSDQLRVHKVSICLCLFSNDSSIIRFTNSNHFGGQHSTSDGDSYNGINKICKLQS